MMELFLCHPKVRFYQNLYFLVTFIQRSFYFKILNLYL